ncbi:unnamed protein product [Linum trigynum]|uniref:Uncharacterized protein n=1 Tax=Linum trigynum TaxID=586398 RepID=A0AAV2EQN2_9ROSI
MHAKRWQIQGGSNLQNCIYRRHVGDLSLQSTKSRKETLNKPENRDISSSYPNPDCEDSGAEKRREREKPQQLHD